MPYKSKAQRGYMHANLPEIAERWDREEGRHTRKTSKTRKKRKRPTKK